jgi:mono/diheme cytochrome c family protein
MNQTANSLLKGTLMILLAGLLGGCAAPMTEVERRQLLGMPSVDFIGSPLEGEQLFGSHCSWCHGTQLQGSGRGPALPHQLYAASVLADERIYRAIRQGAPQRNWRFGAMPERGYLSADQAGHILAYIRQLQWEAGLL